MLLHVQPGFRCAPEVFSPALTPALAWDSAGSMFFPENTLDNKESGFPTKWLLGSQMVSTYNQKEKAANDAVRGQWRYGSLYH